MFLTDDIKKSIRQKILQIGMVKKIILFGSFINGNASEDSDIDILVVKEHIDSLLREKKQILNALKAIDYPKDILLVDEEAFEFYKKEACSVYRDAYENGEVIWTS